MSIIFSLVVTTTSVMLLLLSSSSNHDKIMINAFSIPRIPFRRTMVLLQSTSTTESDSSSSSSSSDFGSAMPKPKTVYEKIGYTEDEMALGIDPDDFLRWIGDRQDLIDKFEVDNKKWSREKATEEADRFMMDAEMVNAFIAYEKRRVDPEWQKMQAQKGSGNSMGEVVGLYAAWIAGGAGLAYVKNEIIEPKYASGEWEPININLDSLFHKGGGEAVTDAVVSTSSATADVAASTSSVADAAVSAVVESDVAGTASDIILGQ